MCDIEKGNASELEWQLESDELETLKLVALGCHRSCSEGIEAIFRNDGIVSWSLNDYLLLKPLQISVARKATKPPPVEPENRRQGDLTWSGGESPQLYYPYFERRLQEIPFLPDIDMAVANADDDSKRVKIYETLSSDRSEAIKTVLSWPIIPNTAEVREHLRAHFPSFTSHLPPNTNGMALIRNWAYFFLPPTGRSPVAEDWWTVEKTYTAWDVAGSVVEDLARPTFDTDGKMNARKQNDLAAAVVEQAVNDHFWLLQISRDKTQAENKQLDKLPVNELVAVSIASRKHFYGYLVVQFPILKEDKKLNDLRIRIKKTLREITVRSYRDVLALFFNRIYEKRLGEKLKMTTSGFKELVEQQMPFSPWRESPDPTQECAKKATTATADLVEEEMTYDFPPTEVEDWLRWLWGERLRECHRTADDSKRAKEHLKGSLVLAKMEIASPPMVDRIKAIMNFGIRFDPEKSGLPSVLIIGGPGSGKDNTARLAPLFSEGYTFGTVQTINMAAIRPQVLVGPLLQGFEWGTVSRNSVFPTIEKNAKEEPPAPTVILDELNSLDIDQQGVLLRIFENSEVTPLFSADHRRAHFLCVGVMNESPEDLMKENELRTMASRSNVFGNILGTFVEEMFRRARRLRPDLYYRMQRFGVIVLPDLQERREDIPILVWSFLPKKDRDGKRRFRYIVELAAYERLMEKDLAWRGNVRELQAVTRKIFLTVYGRLEPQDLGSTGESIRLQITRADVNSVLTEHLRQSGLAVGTP